MFVLLLRQMKGVDSMLRLLNEYKGVILFVAVIVLMTNLLCINVEHINAREQAAIATYAK